MNRLQTRTCPFCKKEFTNRKWEQTFCSFSCGVRNRYFEKNKIDISGDLYEVMEGTLLSDAGLHIHKGGVNPRYTMKQCAAHKEYVEYVAKFWHLEDKIKFMQAPPDFRGTVRKANLFYTPISTSLLPHYKRWYPEGVKIIPKDLVLTPLMLLNAYLGDGSLKTNGRARQSDGGRCLQPVLYTNGFTEDDVRNVLIPKFKEIGIESYLMWDEYKPVRKYPVTYISLKSTRKFFDFIGPCPVNCFEYKWPNNTQVPIE